jgi:hypothetical protein
VHREVKENLATAKARRLVESVSTDVETELVWCGERQPAKSLFGPVRGIAGEQSIRRGSLLSYASEQCDEFRLAATYANRILKAEKPSELPVQAPTQYDLVINS